MVPEPHYSVPQNNTRVRVAVEEVDKMVRVTGEEEDKMVKMAEEEAERKLSHGVRGLAEEKKEVKC